MSIIKIEFYHILILALTISAYLVVHLNTIQATPPPPSKKRRCGRSKFGRTTKGGNNKTAAAVTPGAASSQNRSRTQTSIQSVMNPTATQLQRKCRDLLLRQTKYQVEIKNLKAQVKCLTVAVSTHTRDTAKLVKSHNIELNSATSMHESTMSKLTGQHSSEITEVRVANDNQIKALRDCHATELRKKAEELKVLAKKLIAEKKSSNEVSTPCNFCLGLIIYSPFYHCLFYCFSF